MATWMVHLRVAEKVFEKIPGLDAGQFAIGNVAPDSGVPDEKWENFNPPKEVTHYRVQNPDGIWAKFADAHFLQEELLGKVTLAEDPVKFSFLFGYFCHIVTDNMWAERIARPLFEEYANEFANTAGFIWEVKKDWYGLDFVYVRTHPNCLFWSTFVDAEYPAEYLSVFPVGAIAKQLAYIKTFYQRTDAQVEHDLRFKNHTYLNEAEMALFVDGAYRSLLRIYQMVWEQGVSLTGKISTLDLLG